MRWRRFAKPIFMSNLKQFIFQLLLTIVNVMWPPYPAETELCAATFLDPQLPSPYTAGRCRGSTLGLSN